MKITKVHPYPTQKKEEEEQAKSKSVMDALYYRSMRNTFYSDPESMGGQKWTPANPKSLKQQFVEGHPDLYPQGWTEQMAQEEKEGR